MDVPLTLDDGEEFNVLSRNAAIEHMPPEILSYIFTLCIDDEGGVPPCIQTAPLLLGRVTRKWRYVSLSTPSLWSSLHVHIGRPLPTSRMFPSIEAWLSRAHSESLSIGLTCSPTPVWTHEMSKVATRLLNVILSHSGHCHRLYLCLGPSVRGGLDNSTIFPMHALRCIDGFPMLQELDVEFYFVNQGDFLSSVVSTAPRLCKANFTSWQPSLLRLGASLDQLKSLRSNSKESVESCAGILKLARELERCRLDLNPADNTHPPDSDISVVHHKLRHLYLGPTNHAQFFDCVTLPALRQLTVDGQKTYTYHSEDHYKVARIHLSTWGQRSFIGFLSRSQCCITQLSFFYVDISTRDLMQCLSSVSCSLTELRIEGGRRGLITPSVLNALTYQPFHPSRETLGPIFVCPLLEGVRMRGSVFGDGGPGRPMVDMLGSRFRLPPYSPGVCRLKWANISGQYSAKQWQRLERLEGEGLDLVVVHCK